MRTRVLLTMFPVKTRLWKDKLFIYLVFFCGSFFSCWSGWFFWCRYTCGASADLQFDLQTFSSCLSSLWSIYPGKDQPCLVCVSSGLICVQFCRCETTISYNVEHVHECSWMLKFYKIFHQKSASRRNGGSPCLNSFPYESHVSHLHSSFLFNFQLFLQNQAASHCSDRWLCKDV